MKNVKKEIYFLEILLGGSILNVLIAFWTLFEKERKFVEKFL